MDEVSIPPPPLLHCLLLSAINIHPFHHCPSTSLLLHLLNPLSFLSSFRIFQLLFFFLLSRFLCFFILKTFSFLFCYSPILYIQYIQVFIPFSILICGFFFPCLSSSPSLSSTRLASHSTIPPFFIFITFKSSFRHHSFLHPNLLLLFHHDSLSLLLYLQHV